MVADNTGFALRKGLMTDANVLKNVNVIIPLNRYSFFEELNHQMLVPIQLQFNITLQDDDELIYNNNNNNNNNNTSYIAHLSITMISALRIKV